MTQRWQRARRYLGLWCLALALIAKPALADDLRIAAPRPSDLTPNASGFFVALDGSVLTARHAVDGCQSLFIIKDGHVARADLIAVSNDADLALLRSSVKPYLAATFAADDKVGGSQPIFSAGYDVLRHMQDRTAVMYNGFALNRQTRPNELAFSLLSEADHGASGSAVLDAKGLVIGLIVRRDIGGASGQSVVVAVSGSAIKTFLRHAGVSVQDSSQPQLGPLQPRAPRAATLSVGVICG
jgi:S1-C subfamily serine protease